MMVVELLGPAGSGKTSLLRALLARDPGVRGDPRRAGWPRWQLGVESAIAMVPASLALFRAARLPWWTTLRLLERAESFATTLTQDVSSGGTAVVLDEGPLYSLARLRLVDPGSVFPPHAERHWQRCVAPWRDSLRLIVWLDAPDVELARRIRRRIKPHRIKHQTDFGIAELLGRYRAAFDRVLAALTPAGGPPVLRLDTSELPFTALADQVLGTLTGRPQPAAYRVMQC